MSDTRATQVVKPMARRIHKYKAEGTVLVTDGFMSMRDAQTVLLETLELWGISGQSDDVIDPILDKIAHALRQGTSAERDFSKVYFVHGSTQCCLEVLRVEAGKFDRSENPVRVWGRSYGQGEVPARIHDMLKDPDNAQLRGEAALDYGCSLDVVHVSFDLADALPRVPGLVLSQVERYVIKSNTSSKAGPSRSAKLGGVEGGSIQSGGSHAAAVTSNSTVGSTAGDTAAPPAMRRPNFAPLR